MAMTNRAALATLLLFLLHLAGAQEETKCAEGDKSCPACIDLDDDCDELVANNECLKSPAYMLHSCRLACGFCKTETKSGTTEEDDENDVENDE